MSIQYAWYETPAPAGRKNRRTNLYTRVISQGRKEKEVLCKVLSKQSIPLPVADVKNLLGLWADWRKFSLNEGNSIERTEPGHFTSALRSKEYVNPYGKKQFDIQVGTMSYYRSSQLKKEIQKATLEKVIRDRNPRLETSERKSHLLTYARKHFDRSYTTRMQTNGCTRYTALQDLKKRIAKGKLIATGNRRQRIYILPFPQTIGKTSCRRQ